MKTTLSRLTVWQYLRASASDHNEALSVLKDLDAGVGIDMGAGFCLDLVGNAYVLTYFSKGGLNRFHHMAALCLDTTAPPFETSLAVQSVSAIIHDLTQTLHKTRDTASAYLAQETMPPAQRLRLQSLSEHVQDMVNALEVL